MRHRQREQARVLDAHTSLLRSRRQSALLPGQMLSVFALELLVLESFLQLAHELVVGGIQRALHDLG